MNEEPKALTPAQVARMFHVSITTVGDWANKGLLPHFRTPGGHRRFWPKDVADFIARETRGEETVA